MDNVEALIPDFDKMEELTRQAAEVSAKLVITKHDLAVLEAEIIREALTNNAYWIGGKQPSMSYCEKVVAKIGNTPEDREKLDQLRKQYAELSEQGELLQHIIWINKDKLELFRTISANERKGFL